VHPLLHAISENALRAPRQPVVNGIVQWKSLSMKTL
jgi:hypothetical protein